MKIVVTGASSFTGYHLAAGYRRGGAEVIAMVGPGKERTGIEAARLARLAEHEIPIVVADLTDPAGVIRMGKEIRPDVWVQHAGYTKGYGGWDYDFERGLAVNMKPLAAIYEVVGQIEGQLILTGTVSEYSDSDAAHEESDNCQPSLPYGLTKLAGTLRARQLAERYQVPTRVARLFLPIGPLDAPGKLLSSALDSLQRRAPIALSPCEQRRDFLHIDDVAALYQRLLHDFSGSLFEIYNVCAGESPSLKSVLLTCCELLGAEAELCQFGAIPMRPGEPPVIRGSNAKAKARLDWAPRPWKEAVQRFCEGH